MRSGTTTEAGRTWAVLDDTRRRLCSTAADLAPPRHTPEGMPSPRCNASWTPSVGPPTDRPLAAILQTQHTTRYDPRLAAIPTTITVFLLSPFTFE